MILFVSIINMWSAFSNSPAQNALAGRSKATCLLRQWSSSNGKRRAAPYPSPPGTESSWRSPRHCPSSLSLTCQNSQGVLSTTFLGSEEGEASKDNLRNRNRRGPGHYTLACGCSGKKQEQEKNRTKFTYKEALPVFWSSSLPWTSGSEGGSAKTSVSSGFIT